MKTPRREKISLAEATSHLLEECRMVLPGIQALFGFQLVAVFNTRFETSLSVTEQVVHLIAIGLVALAVALVMAPAAYHRHIGSDEVSDEFVLVASRLLLWSMFPLMAGICLDFYLIGRIILHDAAVSLALAFLLAGVFVVLWLLLPRMKTLQKVVRGRD